MSRLVINSNFNPLYKKHALDWFPIILGLLAMYVPTYIGVLSFAWKGEDQSHGPIVLGVVLYLFWLKREVLFSASSVKPDVWSGVFLFLIGLIAYVLGRSQDIVMLDLGSQIPILMAIILITRGWPALKKLWFPLFFIIFMLPLPVDAITMPMKMAVSYVTETILYSAGYPIGRSGVILQIGQYQLFVADACAGMHTLISLEALGLLYLNLVKHDSLARNILLALCIIPISFTANVIRVIAITLITYYFGNDVGQGFVHGFAGLFLFVVALTLIMTLDNAIQYWVERNKRNKVI